MRSIRLKDNSVYKFDCMKIMGIINVTPDSFYGSSRVSGVDAAVQRAIKMSEEGADIIDIGGESTRPGSDPLDEGEEIERVVPVIEGIRKQRKDILISVDTYHAGTAESAVIAGADIINDISAFEGDEKMAAVAVKYNVPVILMHMKGKPKDMQKNASYENVFDEVMEYFCSRIRYALDMGIARDRIILDPGIGFGKDYEHNIELIKRAGEMHELDLPVLLAVSRKSSIGKALNGLPAEERLEGTMAVTAYACLKDIEIVRVHDVKENKRIVMMTEVLK